MSHPFEINVYDRYSGEIITEKVYFDSLIRFAYDSFAGKLLAPFIGSKFVSSVYGLMQNLSYSSRKVPGFIKEYDIKIDEFEKGSLNSRPIENSYATFNEFFIRKFKKESRLFSLKNNQMPAFAEARYFGHNCISDHLKVPVKGSMLKAVDLMNDSELAKDFIGGPVLVARLCPVDYHRYHYPDGGKTLKSYSVHGNYHSVNPLALKYRNNIFIKNERRISILETRNFGKLAYIEIGATCVGKIIQSHDESVSFNRRDEKGYFLFGGSTVILYGEKGKWKPSTDILENTSLGIETYVKLSDKVASCIV